jgi:S-adenosylmethionine:tRNA ribosyltransferase-isomerase
MSNDSIGEEEEFMTDADSSMHNVEILKPYYGKTNLFIYPGYEWQVIDGLITNFHLPRSSLLMLVSALIGRERLLALYREAIAHQYRFYSFGDAMLILPEAVS